MERTRIADTASGRRDATGSADKNELIGSPTDIQHLIFSAAATGKLAFSVEEAAKVCGLSRAFIYAEWKAGRGPKKYKAGYRTLITAEALIAWLRSLERKPNE
jgi:hypothetical protein